MPGSSRFTGCGHFLGWLRASAVSSCYIKVSPSTYSILTAVIWNRLPWFSPCYVSPILTIMEHITWNKSFVKANTHPQSKLCSLNHAGMVLPRVCHKDLSISFPIPQNFYPFHSGVCKDIPEVTVFDLQREIPTFLTSFLLGTADFFHMELHASCCKYFKRYGAMCELKDKWSKRQSERI